MLCVGFTYAQEKTVSGNVTDQNGLPLPGVNIVVEGTSTGTQTDFDGNYTIQAEEGQILAFTYIGQKQEKRTIGASNTIDVQMDEDAQALEEVIVLGYATTNEAELTGSAVQLNSENFEQVPVSTVDQALQGKVPGLVLNNASGTPGSATDIRIRGVSSITAGNDPLYVIDGVPMVNTTSSDALSSDTFSGSSFSPLASINNNDVESITVLKDASATAAYGARGSNGVIVITTKSGKAGKTSFNFSTSFGFSNDAVEGPQVLKAAERETLFYEAVYNTFGESEGFTQEGARAYYENVLGDPYGYATWNAVGRPEPNWGEVITNKNAPIIEYNLSASGGGEGYGFFTSLGYYQQEATVIGSDFDRISGTLNFDKDLTENWKFSSKNTASYSFQDGLLESSAYFSSPRAVKFFMSPLDQPYNSDGSLNIFDTSLPNPLYIAEEDLDESKFTRVITNNSLNWSTPIENLSFTTRVNIDYQSYNYRRYRNPVKGDGDGSNGYGWNAQSTRANLVFQNSLDYNWYLGDNHQIDFKALQEFQKNKFNYLEADGDNFADVGLTYLNSAGNPTLANAFFEDWSVASYLGMIHYSAFQGKYVLDATYRREGNSRFAFDNRWGNFYSAGAAWNLHKENFLLDNNVINNLKLRGSYGVTGNANIDLNQYQALLAYDSDYAGEGASYPSTVGNQDLSWETAHSLDVGFDFGVLQNRITGSLAYYERESKDLLLDVPLSLTTGFEDQTRNIGRMENKGIEAEINFKIVRSENLNISLGGNMATTNNEVLELAEDTQGEEINITTQTTRIESGHPVRAWYMPTWAGVDSANGDELYYLDGVGSETTNNWNEAESEFQGGSAIPEITAGANFHIDFSGFYIDVDAYYAGGHKVYEDWHRYTNGIDLNSLGSFQGVDALLDRWQEPGDVTRFGRMQYANFPWQRHSKFLYEGDFIRIRNLTFGHNFNTKFTELIGIASARVFLKGTNLFTWVKDDRLKYDPETAADGFTGFTTPPVKSVIFGVNVKF